MSNKPLLIVAGVIAVAVAGYVVYMSYFTARATVGKDANVVGSENTNRLPAITTTDEQKINALNSLTSSTNAPASTVSDSAKEKILNNAASSPKNNATPAQDAEKIKLLESLKK
ncbi:MAG: hypothetical protein Q7S08_02320 [bacterium]|nr:hypothetical protein [bacterium]